MIKMSLQAQPLPWDPAALSAFVSAESTNIHYDDFYLKYVETLNKPENLRIIAGRTLDQVMIEMVGPLAEFARQKWNHDFFWKGLSPQPGTFRGEIEGLIINQYKSLEEFKRIFEERVTNHFASGWIWLAWDPVIRMLEIIDGQDSFNPLQDGYIPLLCLDVWEHSYYLNYPGNKSSYCRNFWQFVDWSKINRLVQENITGPPLFYG